MPADDGTIRILHLFARTPDYQTERSAALLRDRLGAGFSVESRFIGRGGDWRHPAAAVLGLRRERFDIVQTWDETALLTAAFARAKRVLHTPQHPIGTQSLRWIRAVQSFDDLQVVCPSATQQRRCVERGLPIDRCHVIRPAADFSRARNEKNPALRAGLGFTPDDIVVLLPGESTIAAAHERGVWAGSILCIIDPRYKILFWGRGRRVERVGRLPSQVGQPEMARSAEARLGRPIEFEHLLGVADLVLNPATGPIATLPLLGCMAAGLPIVSTVTYTTAELLEDRHTAFIAKKGSPRFLAKRVLELREDPSAAWAIADRARAEAYELFSVSAFIEAYRETFRKMAGQVSLQV